MLAVMQGLVGVWAMLGPESSYQGFPGAGHAWVALLPEYNEHLTRDVGALSLALTVVLVAAAWWPERRLVRIAVIAFAVYAIPHAVFHPTHLEGFPSVDAAAQTIGTVLQVVLTVALPAPGSRLPAPGSPHRGSGVICSHSAAGSAIAPPTPEHSRAAEP